MFLIVLNWSRRCFDTPVWLLREINLVYYSCVVFVPSFFRPILSGLFFLHECDWRYFFCAFKFWWSIHFYFCVVIDSISDGTSVVFVCLEIGQIWPSVGNWPPPSLILTVRCPFPPSPVCTWSYLSWERALCLTGILSQALDSTIYDTLHELSCFT